MLARRTCSSECLEPRHVVPRRRAARRRSACAASASRSVTRPRGEPARRGRREGALCDAHRGDRCRGSTRGRASARPRRGEPAREVAERVRRRDRGEQSDPTAARPRAGARATPSARRRPRYGGRRRARRAVDVAELGAGFGDVGVRVPAAAAEERRRETELSQPARPRRERARPVSPSGRPRVVRGWSSACGGRAGPERSSLAGALEPDASSSPAPRRPAACSAAIAKPPGPTPLQRDEARPHRVVERSLNVAGDDRVPFRVPWRPSSSKLA